MSDGAGFWVLLFLALGLVITVQLRVDFVTQHRDWQAQKAALHAWRDAQRQEWQRKIAAQEADDAAYREAARRCAVRLSGKPEDTPYDEAFIGLTVAEQFSCLPTRILRGTADY